MNGGEWLWMLPNQSSCNPRENNSMKKTQTKKGRHRKRKIKKNL